MLQKFKTVLAGMRGVQGKIFAAVGAIAGMTVLAGLSGWLSYENVGRTLDKVSQESLPQMISAFSISEIGAGISSGAPLLLAASDDEGRKAAFAELQQRLQDLRNRTDQLAESGFQGDSIAHMTEIAGALSDNLTGIDGIVAQRLALADKLSALNADLFKLKHDFDVTIGPYIDGTRGIRKDR